MYSINDLEKVTVIFRNNVKGLKEIHLFGSYARGDERDDSDLDIAAIVTTRPEGIERQNVLNALYKELGENNITADIVFKPAGEFEIDKTIPVTLAYTIANEGKLIWKTDD
jgi:predicted nucleotidyltransferase